MWLFILQWTIVLYLVYRVYVFLVSDADYPVWSARVNGSYLQGKTIVVTGASSGLGENLCLELCKHPIRAIVLCARREKELERVAIACRAVVAKQGHVDNVTVAVRVLDQLKFDTHGAFALDIERAYGKVDILVNNAGRSQRGSLLDTELEVYRGLLELNVLGVVSLTKAFMPVLAAHRGHIVSVGSCAGKIAAPMQGPYALSKFAVTGFMDTLRSEIGADGYTFTTICPGPVYSNGANAGFSTKVKVATRQEAKTAKKMNPGRYSELAVRAISNRVGESWICEQPVLFGMYAHQYTPNFAKMFMQSIGAKRVAMWKRGTDVNAISFKVYVKNFLGSLVGKSTKNE